MSAKLNYDQLLGKMIDQYVVPVLAPHQYQKNGRNFFKRVEPYWYVINVQATVDEGEDHMKLTLNINRHDEKYDQRRRADFPKYYECKPLASVRLGELIGGQDKWWKIFSEQDIAAIGTELAQLLKEKILPCFVDWDSNPAVLRRKQKFL